MDRIDRQIVHCLQRNGRASFRRIAEVLEVSEQTVARRYRILHHEGALRVLVLPDARALGAQNWFVRILCRPDSADILAETLAARDDVSWVSTTAGGSELVCSTRSSRETGQPSVLLQRLPHTNQVLSFTAGSVLHMHVGGEAEWLGFGDPLTADQVAALHRDVVPVRGGAAVPTPITSADAPLLAMLAKDGRAGTVALAKATGWPQMRVSGRLEELLGSGALGIEVDLAPNLFGMGSTAYLWITVAPGELHETGRVLSLHPQTSFAAAVTGVANLLTVVTCRDADELYSFVTTQVGALAAVRQVEIVPVFRRFKQAGTRVRNGRLELAPG